jgi:hypothetical protein
MSGTTEKYTLLTARSDRPGCGWHALPADEALVRLSS